MIYRTENCIKLTLDSPRQNKYVAPSYFCNISYMTVMHIFCNKYAIKHHIKTNFFFQIDMLQSVCKNVLCFVTHYMIKCCGQVQMFLKFVLYWPREGALLNNVGAISIKKRAKTQE